MSRPIFVAERLRDCLREGIETSLRVGTPFYIGLIVFGLALRLMTGGSR